MALFEPGSGDTAGVRVLQFFGKWLKRFALWALALAVTQGIYEYAHGQENNPSISTPATAPEAPPVRGSPAANTKAPAAAQSEATPGKAPAVHGAETAGTVSEQSEAAQPSGASGQDTAKTATVVEEPPVYYVRDKQGRLIPLLGFTYEEILSLIQQKKTGQTAPPTPQGYSLEQLVITGEVHGERAELVAEYKINLSDAGWVNVSLLNSGAVLQEPATFRGEAEHQVQYDSQTGAYVVRLHGAAGSQEQITLKLIGPIKTIAAQHRMEIDFPTAAASRLALQVPQAPIELISHNGCTMAEVKSQKNNSNNSSGSNNGSTKNSEIALWGLGGPLQLAWQERSAAENSSAVLEATGQVFAQIDSRSVQFDALLTVRGFGTQFDKFHVKLPPGAQLTGGAPAEAGYTLTATAQPHEDRTDGPPAAGGKVVGTGNPSEVATKPGAGDQPKADQSSNTQWVEVQLARPTAEPVEVRIQAERAYDVTKPNPALELAGFEIQEAAPHRQWGHIAVAVVGDWQVGWGERDRVRQIAELPAALQRQGVVAGFEYFGQPASLKVRMAPRKTRISVEPEYVYYVEARQVRLEARLKYNIRGAKTSALEIALPGWEIDEIGPADFVDTNAPLSNHGTLFIAPLLQPAVGELELTIKAHRDLAVDASRLEISLPLPTADVIGPALIAIVPADNVRLRARDDELQGLIRPSVAPRIKLPPREQSPLLYRGEQAQATFVGDLERLPQIISAGVQSEVAVAHDEIHVEQRFAYRVEHEPTSSLVFEVPQTLLTSSHLEWLLDDETLAPASPGPASADAKTVRVEVPLPEPRLGTFEVVARYQAPLSQWAADSNEPLNGPLTVPLVMPALAALDRNRAAISGESAARLQPHDEAWTVAEEPLENNLEGERPALRLTASQPTGQIGLAWRPGTQSEGGATVVERAWVQSWLSGAAVRQDRAVYRFNSSADELALYLPQGISAGNLELRLDQRLLPSLPASDGLLKVKLPPGNEDQPHVLELRYQWNDVANRSRAIEVELPRFANGVWVRRLYWQLVLPSDEHLLFSPAELTPEFDWKWSGLGWDRQAAWDQGELEKWVGASTADPLPNATNRYLFSTIGSPVKFAAASAARWQIVLVSSALALAVGLLLLYVPMRLKPWSLIAVGVMMVVLSACVPDAALLFLQAAVLGCALILLAGLLQHTVARRRAAGWVVPGGGSSIVERSSSIQRKNHGLEMSGAASTSVTESLDLPAAGSQHA